MEVLYPYILMNRDIIDHWLIWVNTHRQRDIEFCREIKKNHPEFVDLVFHEMPIERPMPQSPFFRTTVNPETIYIKFDDDICYVSPDAVKKLVQHRIEHPDPLIVIANTICNGICSSIHQTISAQEFSTHLEPIFNNPLWDTVELAEHTHHNFIADLLQDRISKYRFTSYTIEDFRKISINCIAWKGQDFLEFGGIIDHINEEEWLCCIKAKQLHRPIEITGDSLVAHFAFYKHRKPFCKGREIDHRILRAYRMIADRNKYTDEMIRRALTSPLL